MALKTAFGITALSRSSLLPVGTTKTVAAAASKENEKVEIGAAALSLSLSLSLLSVEEDAESDDLISNLLY